MVLTSLREEFCAGADLPRCSMEGSPSPCSYSNQGELCSETGNVSAILYTAHYVHCTLYTAHSVHCILYTVH